MLKMMRGVISFDCLWWQGVVIFECSIMDVDLRIENLTSLFVMIGRYMSEIWWDVSFYFKWYCQSQGEKGLEEDET